MLAQQANLSGFELKPRSSQNGKTRIKGINSSDFIYLIMPDRFSNGDGSNDRIAGLRDQSPRPPPIILNAMAAISKTSKTISATCNSWA